VRAADGSSSISTSDDKASVADGAAARAAAPNRARVILMRVAGALALGVYTLGFGELFVRVFSPQPVMPRYVTATPWGVRGNIPHAHYWHHTPEVNVEYRINGQGLRADRDYALRKPAATCRIAVFGDSLLMGYEVELKDTFGAQLEQLLRSQGYRAEVLNFSVSGFGTAEMLRTYEAFARPFDPDSVIFSWHVTDMDDNVRSALYRLQEGELENANGSYLPGVTIQDFLMRSDLYRVVADNSQLYALLRERLDIFGKRLLQQLRQSQPAKVTAAKQNSQEDEDDAAHAAQSQANVALSSAIVAHAAQVVAADGKEFYLLEIPIRVTRVQFRSSVNILSPDVRARVTLVSPLTAFAAAARPELKLFYERGEGHLTPIGVQLLAREAAKALADSPRLATCTAGAPAQPAGIAPSLAH
jgi:hypothetical protein